MDAFVIIGVTFINAVIVISKKAEKPIDALAQMIITQATVQRNGGKLRNAWRSPAITIGARRISVESLILRSHRPQ